MPLKVIGAGFGRTGTKSLKTALEILGVGPCYHMVEVGNNEGHRILWNEIAFGKKPDWDTLFENYQSGVDWPIRHYWQQLAAYYPEAKVILTVRDPEAWYKSFSDTIYSTIHDPLPADAPEENKRHRQTIHKMITEDTFHFKGDDKIHAINVFMENIEKVKRTIAPERILVYDITEGWEPLSAFLGVPIPDEPFPKTNSTQEFLSQDPRRKTESKTE
jgi:hypothetical protein